MNPAPAAATMAVSRQPGTIIAGRGQRHALLQHLPAGCRTAIMVTDARMAGTDAFHQLCRDLSDGDVAVQVIDTVQPELPVEGVIAAARRVAPADVCIGIGGGSCLDFAKVLSLLVTHGGTPQDYYGENQIPGPLLPVIALPTTAGTGSEVTPIAVLADPDREMKVGISSPHLIPLVAMCDPDLIDSAPASVSAASGADALSHAVESFTAIRREPEPGLAAQRVFIGKSRLTDQYALHAITLIGRSIELAIREGDSATGRSARDDMALAATCGGLAIATGGTAAAHALQYPIGALTKTAHGVGVGILLPYVMEFNRPERTAELAAVGRALGGAEASDEDTARWAIDEVSRLIQAIGLPKSLAEIGLLTADIALVARQATTAARLVENNPRPLDLAALEAITLAAHAGDVTLLS